jgi:hypothetical protein
MITVNITPEQLERAKSIYMFGALTNSITKGESNQYGAIGEVIVNDYFKAKGKDVNHVGHYDYDLVINGLKVDVKTKKVAKLDIVNVLASIPIYNTHQKCDYYIFCQVTADASLGYILGFIPKDEYFSKAFFRKKGDVDTNGFVFKSDCYNMKVENLNPIK